MDKWDLFSILAALAVVAVVAVVFGQASDIPADQTEPAVISGPTPTPGNPGITPMATTAPGPQRIAYEADYRKYPGTTFRPT